MNPGVAADLVAERRRALRANAIPGSGTAGLRSRAAAVSWWTTASVTRVVRSRVGIRPLGRALIRVGRRLAGPEPEGTLVVMRRPGWSR